MDSLKEQVRTIANDLVKLEINTILKAEITGGKMPHPLHALVEVAALYRDYLEREGTLYTDLDPPLADEPRPCTAWQTFDWLREWSDQDIQRLTREESERRKGQSGPAALTATHEAHYNLLSRIRDTCDHFKGMLESLKSGQSGALEPGLKLLLGLEGRDARPQNGQDFTHTGIEKLARDLNQTRLRVPFTSDDLVRIRKAWEIGLERIVMQTVVHLDGDIITRIHPQCVAAEYDTLRLYHRQTTEQSIQMWQQFINAVGSFFERIIRDLLGRS